MVAAPFKISMVVENARRERKFIALTASDVNGEYAIFPSGGSELPISTTNCRIVDMILSAAGTDTSQLELFINGNTTGTKLLNATSIATTVGRPVQLSPIPVAANQTVRWKQLT